MKRWLVWLMTSFVFVVAGSYAWTHRHRLVASVAEPAPQPEVIYTEAQEAQKMVTVAGPMADYVQRRQRAGAGTNGEPSAEPSAESSGESNVVTLPSIARKPSALDHVGDSPVGTSAAILHRAFRVAGMVDVPFDIPAHASNPQLRGTYSSFVQQGGVASSDSGADVEFLLMNDQQYANFLAERPGDALFSAADAHNGEINFNLPPTLTRPAKYYLVFRNNSQNEDKKTVQADFRVNF